MANTIFTATAAAGGSASALVPHAAADKRYAEMIIFGSAAMGDTLMGVFQFRPDGSFHTINYVASGRIESRYSNGDVLFTQAPVYGPDDVIGFATDRVTGDVWVSKNGAYLKGGDPATGAGAVGRLTFNSEIYFGVSFLTKGLSCVLFTAATKYPKPSGFIEWESGNAPPVDDSTPNQFDFPDVTARSESGSTTTPGVNIRGFNTPITVALTWSGTQEDIDGIVVNGAFLGTGVYSAEIVDGDLVAFQYTPAGGAHSTLFTVTAGGVTDTFTVTTTATKFDVIPTPSAITRAEQNTTITSIVELRPRGGTPPYLVELRVPPGSEDFVVNPSGSRSLNAAQVLNVEITTTASTAQTFAAELEIIGSDSAGETDQQLWPISHEHTVASAGGGDGMR